jgi:hypothetical protein
VDPRRPHSGLAMLISRINLRDRLIFAALYHSAEGLPLGRMPSQYVNLMPKDQDFGCQRGPRSNNNTGADQIKLQASLTR